MFISRIYKTIPILLLSLLLFSDIASAMQAAPEFEITNYVFVSEKRISRTVYEYTFQAEVTNISGEDAENVVGTLTVTDENGGTTVVDGKIQFGDIPAGSSLTCTTDILTISMDMTKTFNGTIEWSFTKDDPPQQTPKLLLTPPLK